MRVIGKGKNASLLEGTDRNARMLNRRVEIIVSVKDGDSLCVNDGESLAPWKIIVA